MALADLNLQQAIDLFTRNTGIIPRETHRSSIKAYIEKRMETLNEPLFANYYMILQSNPLEFSNLVNESTVNETYFFREEKQFQFIKDKLFPMWQSKTGGSEINIWCAACSTGEEAYSLAMLSKHCHIRANITASDINTNVLNICKEGNYKAASCRQVDGGFFNFLLDAYKQKDGSYKMSEELRNSITTKQINLSNLGMTETFSSLPKNQHIIFIRNVFIYFSMELRAEILQTVTDKCLADDGYIFVSMSEVAPLDDKIIPKSLEKIADGNVFCFHKKAK